MSMVHIDGGHGEGGGQILRSALALFAATGRPFRITRVRAARKKPGLQPQHLTAVEAVARICSARVEGAALGATELGFEPGPVMLSGHEHTFAVGTAGSAILVAHAVLPALVHAGVSARLVIEGGTHVPFAPVGEHLPVEVFSAIGERAVRAERVAERLAGEANGYLDAGVPVGEHTADQLLLPLALGRVERSSPSSPPSTPARTST